MVEGSTTDVGMDTSKSSIQVAMLLPGRREAVEWELANEPQAVKRLVKRLKRGAITVQSTPPSRSWRCRPYPHGRTRSNSTHSESSSVGGVGCSWLRTPPA